MGAPKGNKFAVDNEGGRPPFYKTVKELQSKVDEYFNGNANKKKIIIGETEIDIPVYTICGLAYYLGFESRQSFYSYEKHEVFSYTIKRARLRIEMSYEQNLTFQNATGSIFALKNMDWKDQTEVKTDSTIKITFTKK